MTTEDLMDELRAALLAEHDAHHPISFAEGCGCETCQLLLRVWEHEHATPPAVGATRNDRGGPERWNAISGQQCPVCKTPRAYDAKGDNG